MEIKNKLTVTRGEVGKRGGWGVVGGKGRQLYLNHNLKKPSVKYYCSVSFENASLIMKPFIEGVNVGNCVSISTYS